jgi:site-specific DNA recombinase
VRRPDGRGRQPRPARLRQPRRARHLREPAHRAARRPAAAGAGRAQGLVGLKERLLAPALVEEFVRAYVAEVNAANRDLGARRAGLEQQQRKLARQIRNLLDLFKDGHGSPAMVGELREVERKHKELGAEITATGTPEPVPALHPNLPALYRRRVEALEDALRDAATAAAAAEALRSLIDAIVVYPGARRGEVAVELRGDLAAFLHLGAAAAGDAAAGNAEAAGNKKAALLAEGGCSVGVLPTLDAGTGFEPVTFRL